MAAANNARPARLQAKMLDQREPSVAVAQPLHVASWIEASIPSKHRGGLARGPQG